MSDDNTNIIIKDSVYFHFFELPSDLEGIQINTILRDRKKVGSEKTVSSSDVPPIFNSPSFNSPFDTTPKKKGRKKKKDNDPWWI